MTVTRRTFVSGGAALSGLIAAPAFAQGGRERALRVAQPWEVRTLQPSEFGSAFTRAGIGETLVFCEPDGRIVPALAESWSTSDDGLVWRFQIRSAAHFHDGTPVTAEFVRSSIEKLLPKSLYLKAAAIQGLAAEGGDLVVALQRPFGPLLAYLVDASVPILAPASFDASGEVASLIGTGPFRLVGLDLPRSLTLGRNEAYWGGPVGTSNAAYEAVANGETRANLAVAGDADIVMNIAAPSVSRVRAGGAVRIDRVIIPRVHILMLNVAKPQFADVRTRRALSLAMDRVGIATTIMRNPALAATQYMVPTLAEWHFADLPPHRQDVAAANALLDGSGWSRGSDSVRSRKGVRFAGLLRTFANRPELPVIATALQAQFKAIGFDLAIQVGDFQAIVESQRDGTFELGLSSRNTAFLPNPIASIATDFTGDTFSPGAQGSTNWRHDGFRRDIAAYLAATDEAARTPLCRAIAEVLHTELPVIPVVWYDQIATVAPRVRGFINDPFEQRWLTDKVSLAS